MNGLDKARLEWQFEALAREHATCCTGALLLHPADGGAPSWVNVLAPVDSDDYRPFPHIERTP